jgi:CHAD domain-containing protein
MNSGLTPVNGAGGARSQFKLAGQFGEWRRLLNECGRKPSKRRVHGLRVATLRLQAEVEFWLREKVAGDSPERAAKRWNKQAEKLRRVLSVVRETDVYLAKLTGLRVAVTAPSGYEPRSSRSSLRQTAELEYRLRQQRRSAAKKLVSQMEQRRERLQKVSIELEAALSPQQPLVPRSASNEVFQMFAGVAAEFHELNAMCLHDFRKQIKKLRYLAELFADSEPEAKRLAMALKAMQVAIGDWHDWHVLAKLARRILEGREKSGGLAELLRTLSSESLQKALDLCREQTAQLVASGAQNDLSPRMLDRKRPVRSDSAQAKASERRLA